jgi:hypothetical protein
MHGAMRRLKHYSNTAEKRQSRHKTGTIEIQNPKNFENGTVHPYNAILFDDSVDGQKSNSTTLRRYFS